MTRGERLALAGVLLVCAVLRLAVLDSRLGRLDGDEAVSGIMAQRILGVGGPAVAGSGAVRFPLYFGGDGYLGAAEQYLQAPFLAVDPTDPLLLRVPLVALAVASCALVAVLGRQVLGRWRAGLLSAGLFAVGPFFALVWSIRSRQTSLALAAGTAGLVLALGTVRDAPRAGVRAAAFGACCGLCFWTNWTAAFLLLPAGVWWLGATRGAWPRLVPPAVVASLLASGPFWWTVASGRVPVFLARPVPDSTPWERLGGLVGPVGGMFLGVREAPPAGTQVPVAGWLPPWLVVAVLVAALSWAVVRRRRELAALLLLRHGAGTVRPGDALLLAALVTPVLYASASFAWYRGEPRYLFPLYALLPVGLAALVPGPSARGVIAGPRGAAAVAGRRGAAGAVAVLLVVALAASSVHGAILTVRRDGRGPGTLPSLVQAKDLPAVADALVAEGVTTAYADYWLAYPLQFVAGDRLTVTSWYTPRFDADHARVQAAAAPSWVAATGRPTEQLSSALAATGAAHRRRTVGAVTLFLDVTPGLQPAARRRDPREAGLRPSTVVGPRGAAS